MRILVTGATGFIGSALVDALLARGHTPVPAVRDIAAARRRWPTLAPVAADFVHDTDPAAWRPRLAGIDAVVNAVGVLRESRAQPFSALHEAAPRALFDACVAAGVARVVQISALGADDAAASAYHRSKRAADAHLHALPLQGCVLRPSLVFAPHGASASLFLRLAALPLAPLPGGGAQEVAPVHLDDIVAAVLALLEHPDPPRVLDAPGPRCMPLRAYLGALRRSLGLGRLRVLAVPMPLVRVVARWMARLPGSLVDADTVGMLERGNCASPDALAAVLGRMPRDVDTFVPPACARALGRDALLGWTLPLLRLSIALVFVATAALSFGLYPRAASHALLADAGLHGAPASFALYAGAALDLLLGLAMLLPRARRPAYAAAIALIAGYTAIITVALPAFWLHPFGPVLKNLPILAALVLLHALDRRR